MSRIISRTSLSTGLALVGLVFGAAVSQADDWTTAGNDAQRSGWVRDDPRVNPSTVRKPDFQLLWKMDFENEPAQVKALTPPVLLDFYVGYRGFRSLGFVGGTSNNVFVMDTDLARVEWVRSMGPPPTGGSDKCPGGMTAQPTRPTAAALPSFGGFRGFGRREPAKSAVSEPNEGSVQLQEIERTGARVAPNREAPSSRTRAASRPPLNALSFLHVLTSEGQLHGLNVSNGMDYDSPIKFLPPDAYARGLIVVDDVAYVATSNGCGGVPDGVWAIDLTTKKVTNWESPGTVVGSFGPTFSPEGSLYATTANGRVTALEAGTLKQIGAHNAAGTTFTSSPLVIDIESQDFLAVAAKDGTIRLLEGAALDKPGSKSPVFAGSDFAPGALSTWTDSDGVVWLLAPVDGKLASGVSLPGSGAVKNGAVVAWKIVKQGGSFKFEPGWVSPNLVSPLTPIIVNGVVFVASSGELKDASLSAEERARRSKPAVVYAIDGKTGKVLWDSGDSITSFATGDTLSSGGGAVYLTTHDGAVYAFGFPIEH